MVNLDAVFQGKDEEKISSMFSFKPGIAASIRTRDGKLFISRYFVTDAEMMIPCIFLRTDDMPERLVCIPWSNVSSVESIVLADDE